MMHKVLQEAILPAYKLLPAEMASAKASVMLLAIGMQESLLQHRRQLVGNPPRPIGPAKSLWQAEIGGGMVHGVRTHPASRKAAAELYKAQGVEANDKDIWNMIEFDDVLAAGLARLLLWTDPIALPEVKDSEGAFKLYLRTWRPGAYTRGTDAQKASLKAKFIEHHKLAQEAVK